MHGCPSYLASSAPRWGLTQPEEVQFNPFDPEPIIDAPPHLDARSYAPTSNTSPLPAPPKIDLSSPFCPGASTIGTSTGRIPLVDPVAWTYDSRHTAQELVPGILIGPTRCAKDVAFLSSTGITLAIGLRSSSEAWALAADAAASRACAAAGATSVSFAAGTGAELIRAFDEVHRAAAAHLHSRPGAKVLVHCVTGNDRAACAGAAYLAAEHGVEYRDAMLYVQGLRFSVVLDEDRKRLLQAYWDVLVARRGVLGEQGRGKRSRVEEDDWEMLAIEQSRDRPRTPFQDV